MTKFLESPRELTPKEVAMYEKAQQKWLPTIIQSFQTPIHEMMVSPVKYSILRSLLLTVLILLGANVYLYFEGIKRTRTFITYNIIAFVVMVVILTSLKYFSVVKNNQNLMLVASLLPTDQIPTKYDYESSSVVQSKLMRASMSRMGSGGLTGGLVGGVVGGSMGRRR